MTAVGLIFSNIHDGSVAELTRMRAIASVPFGGKYRLIDFALSNFVNADINKVGVITHYNYQSLLDHIGTGMDWDLARRSGGLKILPPFITAYENPSASSVYSTRLEALLGVMNFIDSCKEEYIVTSDCDIVCNIDIADILKQHKETGADVTIAVTRVKPKDYPLTGYSIVVKSDKDKNITDIVDYTNEQEEIDISMNVFVMKRSYLQNVLLNAAAHGYKSFYHDVLARHLGRSNIKIYRYEGYYDLVGSMQSYFACNMRLLKDENRKKVFGIKSRPIITKVRNTPPTRYESGAVVKDSIIADGCEIEGTVENSVIFRGVKIGKGAVVKNSVIMQGSYIGKDSKINCVIADKNVVIKDGRELSGHETIPFFIEKGRSV